MFNWQSLNFNIGKAVTVVKEHNIQHGKIMAQKDMYAPEFLQQKARELASEASVKLDAIFKELREWVPYEVSKAESKTTIEVPFDERTYYATSAYQDAHGRAPEALLKLYADYADTGNRGRTRELERILEPMLSASGHAHEWESMKASYRTPQEVEAHALRTAAPHLLNMLNPVEQIIRSSVGSDTASDLENITQIMSQVQQNTERQAGL